MKEYKLYGDEKVKKETVYEVIKVPLQDQVSVVRKFLSQTWKHVKVGAFVVYFETHCYSYLHAVDKERCSKSLC